VLLSARFFKQGSERFGWDDERSETQWLDAVNDNTVPKGTDEYQNATVAKFRRQEVVSGRTLKHVRELRQKLTLEDTDLETAKKRASLGTHIQSNSTCLAQSYQACLDVPEAPPTTSFLKHLLSFA
jgi:hypothetical protein